MTKKKKKYSEEEQKEIYAKAIPPTERKVRVGKRVVRLSEQIWQDIDEKKKKKKQERLRRVGHASRSLFAPEMIIWIISILIMMLTVQLLLIPPLTDFSENIAGEPTFIEWMVNQEIYGKAIEMGSVIPAGFYKITVEARYAAAESYLVEIKEGNNLYAISVPGDFYMADSFVVYFEGRLSNKVYQHATTKAYYVFCEDGADADYNDLILKIVEEK